MNPDLLLIAVAATTLAVFVSVAAGLNCATRRLLAAARVAAEATATCAGWAARKTRWFLGCTPRHLADAPEDYAPLTPAQEDAMDIIEHNYYVTTASERVYPAAWKPWWQRRWRGYVVVVREQPPVRRRPW